MLLESCPVLTSACLLSFHHLIVQIVLIVGMKLQLIILEMALQIQGRHVVVKETPVVQLSDKLFWFGRPQFLFSLIHFTLFQVSKYMHCQIVLSEFYILYIMFMTITTA